MSSSGVPSARTPKSAQPLFSRRSLLCTLPALGITLVSPASASAQLKSEGCSVTAADSLLYYSLLLEQVKADAISAKGHVVAKQLQDCDDLLDKLKTQLEHLNRRLGQKGSSTGVSQDLRDYGRGLETNLQLIKGQHSGRIDPAMIVTLSTNGSALQRYLLELARDCDPDPTGETRKLIGEILDAVTAQNKGVEDYQSAEKKWQEQISGIDRQFDRLRSEIDMAVFAFTTPRVAIAPPSYASPEEHLDNVVKGLNQIEVASPYAKNALIELLQAVATMIKSPASPRPASYNSFQSAVLGISDPQSVVSESLMDRIGKVIHNPQYFVPGSFLQSMACVAICLPVWVSYQADKDKTTRVRLIRSILPFVRGVKTEKIDEIALALADISVGALRA